MTLLGIENIPVKLLHGQPKASPRAE